MGNLKFFSAEALFMLFLGPRQVVGVAGSGGRFVFRTGPFESNKGAVEPGWEVGSDEPPRIRTHKEIDTWITVLEPQNL